MKELLAYLLRKATKWEIYSVLLNKAQYDSNQHIYKLINIRFFSLVGFGIKTMFRGIVFFIEGICSPCVAWHFRWLAVHIESHVC